MLSQYKRADEAPVPGSQYSITLSSSSSRVSTLSSHNGPSGQALDESVLAPLGLSREGIRVADVDNRYMANPAQQKAIAGSYKDLVDQGLVPPVTWRPRRPIAQLPADRHPSLAEEFDEARPDWVITLGEDPLRALDLEGLGVADYGVPISAAILGHKVQLLRLVHTRQQAGHGFHSSAWAQAHRVWAGGQGAATVRHAITNRQ